VTTDNVTEDVVVGFPTDTKYDANNLIEKMSFLTKYVIVKKSSPTKRRVSLAVTNIVRHSTKCIGLLYYVLVVFDLRGVTGVSRGVSQYSQVLLNRCHCRHAPHSLPDKNIPVILG